MLGQNQLNRQQMVQFDCPEYGNPSVSFTFGRFLFAPFLPSFLSLAAGVIRNWTSQYERQKVEKFWAKISLAGCKWSSLNAPGSQTPYCNTFYCRSPSILCFRTRTAFDAAARRHAFRRSHTLMIFKRFCDKRFATSASRFHPHLKSPLIQSPAPAPCPKIGKRMRRFWRKIV